MQEGVADPLYDFFGGVNVVLVPFVAVIVQCFAEIVWEYPHCCCELVVGF